MVPEADVPSVVRVSLFSDVSFVVGELMVEDSSSVEGALVVEDPSVTVVLMFTYCMAVPVPHKPVSPDSHKNFVKVS